MAVHAPRVLKVNKINAKEYKTAKTNLILNNTINCQNLMLCHGTEHPIYMTRKRKFYFNQNFYLQIPFENARPNIQH